MAKPKVLGTAYGIEITRPWNPAMYEHNEKVADRMKEAIFAAMNKALVPEDRETMHTIVQALSGYSYRSSDYSCNELHREGRRELGRVANYWLAGSTWPDLVKAGLVEDIDIKFVGYDK